VYGYEQQPGTRNHEGEQDDQSHRGDIQTRNVAEDQYSSTTYLSQVATNAPKKPIGPTIGSGAAQPGGLYEVVNVAHHGNGRD
jgi:hypothetical protein